MNTATSDTTYFNPTVAGTCEVLEQLVGTSESLTVTQLASRTQLTRGTALRVMRTLASVGIAQDVGNARYTPGPRLLSIALRLNTTTTLANIVQPHLKSLSSITGETSHFAILDHDKALIVNVCDSPNALRVASRAGTSAWLHAAATGKAILASLPQEQREEICHRLHYEKLTNKTITNSKEMLTHLKQVARQGYGVDDIEYFIGVRCIAAPVQLDGDHHNHIGAIGITAATARITKKDIPEMAKIVRKAAEELSQSFVSDS